MKIPSHLTNHAFEYLIVALLGAGWFGFEAYMDARHVMRVEAAAKERSATIRDYEQQMVGVDEEIERLELLREVLMERASEIELAIQTSFESATQFGGMTASEFKKLGRNYLRLWIVGAILEREARLYSSELHGNPHGYHLSRNGALRRARGERKVDLIRELANVKLVIFRGFGTNLSQETIAECRLLLAKAARGDF